MMNALRRNVVIRTPGVPYRVVKTALVAVTVGNALDLATSLIDFTVFGAYEANLWAGFIHNSVIACLIAIVLTQVIATAMWLIGRRYPGTRFFVLEGLAGLVLIKSEAVLNNVLLMLGIQLPLP